MSAAIRPISAPIFGNGFATAALALGIVGVGLSLTTLFTPVTLGVGLLAIVFGLIGLVRAYRHHHGNAAMAVLGTLAGLAVIVLAIITRLG